MRAGIVRGRRASLAAPAQTKKIKPTTPKNGDQTHAIPPNLCPCLCDHASRGAICNAGHFLFLQQHKNVSLMPPK
jgi:hypothetical protein